MAIFEAAEQALATIQSRLEDLEAASLRQFATVDDAPPGVDPLGWLLNPSESTHRLPVLISGFHETRETIRTAANHGLSITTAGRVLDHRVDESSNLRGAGAVISWTGPPGRTVWEYSGSGINGHLPTISGGNNTQKRPGIGLLVTRRPGMNPAKSAIDSASFVNVETAIQCGVAPDEMGCDNLHIGNLHLWECDRGLWLRTQQSMDHHINVIYANDCKRIFVVDAGGRLSASSITVVERTEKILEIGEGPIGINNGSFWLRNLKIDSKSAHVVIVDMKASKSVTVRVDGVHIASPGLGVRYRMRAPGALTISDHKYLRPGAIETLASNKPTEFANVCVERSLLGKALAAEPKTLFSSASAMGTITLRDCYDIEGQAIPNVILSRGA